MKKERMKILNMVEEGKISVDEAAKLMESLSQFEHSEVEEVADDFREKCEQFSKSMDGFAKEFGTKVNDVYKEMEPKLKSMTRSLVEKTATVVDDISKSIHESLEKNQTPPEDEEENREN